MRRPMDEREMQILDDIRNDILAVLSANAPRVEDRKVSENENAERLVNVIVMAQAAAIGRTLLVFDYESASQILDNMVTFIKVYIRRELERRSIAGDETAGSIKAKVYGAKDYGLE